MKFEVFIALACVLATVNVSVVVADNPDGSRCPNVACSPPLPGASCRASYERDDGCCPVWYCNMNGVTSTIYGKSQSGGGNGGSSSSSWSSSSGSGGGGGGGNSFHSSSSSFGGLPQIRLNNILGSLFGR